MVKARPGLGRRKIEIKRIQNEVARQVSFSKRRTSAFKKANELSILCGAEIAAVVFSPAGKAFSFGHPSVDTVMNRFLNTSCQDVAIMSSGSQGNAGTLPTPRGLQLEIEEINNLVEVEKLKGKQLEDGIGSNCDERLLRWFHSGAEALGLNDLEDIQEELVALKSAVRGHISGCYYK